jgi:putative DNA primase/helicase
MSTKDEALMLARRGHDVFPAKLDKSPYVMWQQEATTDEGTISAWWDRWPDALIGLRLALGTMVVDIDELEPVRASGLEFPETSGQQTRSRGFHLLLPHRRTQRAAGRQARWAPARYARGRQGLHHRLGPSGHHGVG